MFESKFRAFSEGIAAMNKKPNSIELAVVPIEIVPMIDGELAEGTEEFGVSSENRLGDSFDVQVKTSSTLTCEWLPFGTNRVTAPDIRRGERVMIYQYGDTDRYYWQPLGWDDDLRRLETVVYAWSATSDEAATLNPAENMYALEVSTHGKHITLTTTDVEDEKTTYKIQLNLKDGQLNVIDKQENYILLNSVEHVFEVKNADGTYAKLAKEDIEAFCKNNLIAEAQNDGTVTIGNNLTAKVKKNATAKVGEKTWVNCPKIDLGEDSSLEPSVLGDKMAAAMADLIQQINASQTIGNLGSPTSAIQAVVPVEVPDLLSGGAVYSTKNRNQ